MGLIESIFGKPKCPTCNGANKYCADCGGDGTFESYKINKCINDDGTCGVCNGTGYASFPHECTNCNGSGYVT